MSDWIPDDEPKRSSKERWVRINEWAMQKVDGVNVPAWTGRMISRTCKFFEVWGEDGKPHRARTEAGLAHIKPRQEGKYGPDKVKEMWGILFWDHATNMERVFTFNQWSIKSALRGIIGEWGTPKEGVVFEYDMMFYKGKGAGDKTVYGVKVPGAAAGTARQPLSPEASVSINALYEAGFNLDALAEGGDPFPSSGAGAGRADDNAGDVPF